MRKLIIFDFNRTIYDPEANTLYPIVPKLLKTLRRNGFELHLVSRANNSRSQLIKDLGLNESFNSAVITKSKSLSDFKKLLEGEEVNKEMSFVIGDRVKEEIRYGNLLGLKTVWLQKGRFADEFPESEQEKPSFTIKNLKELLDLII